VVKATLAAILCATCLLPASAVGHEAQAARGATTRHQASPQPRPVKSPPNVVVILADDLGWPDVSAYGRSEVPTPNIDRIAKSGAAFTNGYVTASVCAVSRAGLLTGKMPQRFGFTYNISDRGNADKGAGLPVGEKTLGDRLKARGYRTGAFGKWHQGQDEQFYPTRRGFDEFFGFLSGETVYVDPKTPGFVTTPTKADKYPLDTRDAAGAVVEGPNRAPVRNFDRYLTDEITDHAVDFIDRSAKGGDRFFAYVAYNAPHWPLQAPQQWYDRFPHIKDPVRRTYVAMIAAMDAGIGEILDELDRTGQRDNTLVVFLSDNGCPQQFGFCDCSHPLGAGKFTYLEGGARVPFVVSWPNGMKPAVVDTPVSSLDITTTVLAAVDRGRPLPKDLDGSDLVAIANGHGDRNRTLLWSQAPVSAARWGKWKLRTSDDAKTAWLYDLSRDPAETHDVAAQNPKVAARLQSNLSAWRSKLPEPLWPLHATRQAMICNRPTEWVY